MKPIPRVACSSPEALTSVAPELRRAIEARGACIVDAWDSAPETFLAIAKKLGAIQSHVLSGPDGMMGEKDSTRQSWQAHRKQYAGLTKKELLPHTDGSFLDGMKLVDGRMTRIGPPKMVLLQCVTHAVRGGENVLVDGRKVFGDLLEQRPELAAILVREKAASFCRDDQVALDFPVYEEIEDGVFRMRFRFDFVMYGDAHSIEALRILHEEFHVNEAYRVRCDLAPGQILLVDNYRMLHGRDAFEVIDGVPENRKLRRIWLNDDDPPRLENVVDDPREPRALDPFQAYGPRWNGSGSCGVSDFVRCGIRLDSRLSSLARELRLQGAGSTSR